MPKLIDMTGERFGRLTVLRRVPGGRAVRWACRCDCGNQVDVSGKEIRRGNTRSCGCLQRERSAEANRQHGGTGSSTHNIWMSMIQRCSNPASPRYSDYGGRGIVVCKRWMNFENFFADMGACPGGRSLDRIDNDGPYSPDNCRWATRIQQANNTRTNKKLTCRGVTLGEAEWARRQKIKRSTLQYRLRQGWPLEQALGFIDRPQAERYRKCE